MHPLDATSASAIGLESGSPSTLRSPAREHGSNIGPSRGVESLSNIEAGNAVGMKTEFIQPRFDGPRYEEHALLVEVTRAPSKMGGAAKKKIPRCSLQPWTCSQVQVLPRQWMVGPSSDILGPPNRDRNGEGSHDRGMSHQTNSDSQRGRGRGMYAQDVQAKKGR